MSNAIVPPSPPTRKITFSVNVFRIISEHPDWYHSYSRELEVPFPEEFVRSDNQRFVKGLSVRAIQLRKIWSGQVYTPEEMMEKEKLIQPRIASDAELKADGSYVRDWTEYLPDLYTLHASFVHDDYNDNHTVAWLNEPLTAPRVYEQFQKERSFRLWVVDSTAEPSSSEYDKRINLHNPSGEIYLDKLHWLDPNQRDAPDVAEQRIKEYRESIGRTFLRIPFNDVEEDNAQKYYHVLVLQMELDF